MTLENTDLHPSHGWVEEVEENDFRYFLCGVCQICSCCFVKEKSRTCDRGWVTVDED